MKRILVAVLVIGLAFAGLIYLVPKESSSTKSEVSKSQVTLGDISANIKKGALLIDVRTIEEFNESHAKGAVNLPVEDIEKGVRPKTAKDKTIYLYCRTGRRAKIAKGILDKDGYENVINLESLDKWQALGGEVE